MRFNITKERLEELFTYDKETGNLYNKIKRKYDQDLSKPVGTLTPYGYLYCKVDGVSYQVHNLIYVLIYGHNPEEIDHIDGNKSNNKLSNLRPCTRNENRANIKVYKSNKLQIKGVQFDEKGQRAIGQVKVDNFRYWKSFRVTSNRSKEQAILEAFLYVLDIREQVHKTFTHHGFNFYITSKDFKNILNNKSTINNLWIERNYSEEQITESIALIKALGLEAILAKAPNPSQNNTAPDNQTSGS